MIPEGLAPSRPFGQPGLSWRRLLLRHGTKVERASGIGPPSNPRQGLVLPLNYARENAPRCGVARHVKVEGQAGFAPAHLSFCRGSPFYLGYWPEVRSVAAAGTGSVLAGDKPSRGRHSRPRARSA